jgi:hypothetical protein
VPTSGAAIQAPNAPLGILLEQASSNSIRNSTSQGGASGVVPTYQSLPTPSALGLTISVYGIGTEEGISYVEFAISGTTTSSGNLVFWLPEGNTSQIAAANGQSWTSSVYSNVSFGTWPSGLILYNSIAEYNSSGTGLGGNNTPLIAPSTGPLSTNRLTNTYTNVNSTTTYENTYYFFNIANSGIITNFRLRFGLPQLEQLPFATSPIPTSGSAVTRNGDTLNFLTGPIFNSREGSLVFEQDAQNVGPSAVYGGLSNGSFNNSLYLSSGNSVSDTENGSGTTVTVGPSPTAGVFFKQGVSFSPQGLLYSNGGTESFGA